MSAFLTHAAIGILLGLALGWPKRFLPLAALLAAFPDLDHLDMWVAQPFLQSRVTLHNMFFCVVAPLAVWGALRWRGLDPRAQKLAAGSTILLTSHLLLDMLPLDPVGGLGRVALFYPLSETRWMMPARIVDTLDPRSVTSMTLLVFLLVGGVLLARSLEWTGRMQGRRLSAVAAPIVVWLMVFPVALGSGMLIQRPPYGEAVLAFEDPYLELPHGRVIATVYHVGGDTAWSLRTELLANGTHVSNGTLGGAIEAGERRVFDFPAGSDPRNLTRLSVRLYGPANHTYAVASLPIRRSHVDTTVTLLEARVEGNSTTVTLRNDGDPTIPRGSLDVRLVRNGTTLGNVTLGAALASGANATVSVPGNATGATLEVRALDDRFLYVRKAV